MPPPTRQTGQIADLELQIAPLGDGLGLTLRYTRPGDRGEDLRGPFPLRIDRERLLALALEPDAYGAELTAQLFGDQEARQAFVGCCHGAVEAGYTLRLRLHLNAPGLHELRWELLRDPAGPEPPQLGSRLALDSRLLLTRYVSAEQRGEVRLRPRGELRALVAVASPANLGQRNLAPIDAAAEIRRAREALAGVAVDVLPADGDTLTALGRALRSGAGYDILYLVAHGAMAADDQTGALAPWLFLADQRGQLLEVPGAELAAVLGGLDERRPRLVVLASCESAGDGYADALAALGPQIARAGVPAVLAMQGKLSVETAGRLTPAFFAELLRDGLADRALAAARLAVARRPDWWMPVLYTRLEYGRVWEEPAPRPTRPPAPVGRAALVALALLLSVWVATAQLWRFQPRPNPLAAACRAAAADERLVLVIPFDETEQASGSAPHALIEGELNRTIRAEGLQGVSAQLANVAPLRLGEDARAEEIAALCRADIVIWGANYTNTFAASMLAFERAESGELTAVPLVELADRGFSDTERESEVYQRFLNGELPALTNAYVLFVLGRAATADRDYAAARDLLAKVTALPASDPIRPIQADASFALGLIEQTTYANPAAAIAAYERAVGLNPGLPTAYYNLGVARQTLADQQRPKSIELFEAAVAAFTSIVEPGQPAPEPEATLRGLAHYNRATARQAIAGLLRERGQAQRDAGELDAAGETIARAEALIGLAEADLNAAIAAPADLPIAYYNLGAGRLAQVNLLEDRALLACRRGQAPPADGAREAERLLREAIDLWGRARADGAPIAVALFDRGNAYRRLGELADARITFTDLRALLTAQEERLRGEGKALGEQDRYFLDAANQSLRELGDAESGPPLPWPSCP